MQNIVLTPHFSLREFTESATARKHGIGNDPPPEAVGNLRRLCEGCLEPLREALGLPIVITSGFRTKALNSLLAHTSERSQHMLGQAADFYVSPAEPTQNQEQSSSLELPKCEGGRRSQSAENAEKLSRRELLVKAFREILTNPKVDFDQLILYPSFIHVSYVSKERNRHGILKALGNGQLGYGRCSLSSALQIE